MSSAAEMVLTLSLGQIATWITGAERSISFRWDYEHVRWPLIASADENFGCKLRGIFVHEHEILFICI